MRKPNEELGSNFKSLMSVELLNGARLAATGNIDEACDLIVHYAKVHGRDVNSQTLKELKDEIEQYYLKIHRHFQDNPECYDPRFSLEDYAIENFTGYFWWNFQIFETEN